MAGGQVSVAVGIGARAGASVEAVVALVREAFARAGVESAPLHAAARIGNPALGEAAARLGVPLYLHNEAALARESSRVVSHSARVAAIFGVGSVAEAAALAGAGEGGRITIAKFSADGVSCAVARGAP